MENGITVELSEEATKQIEKIVDKSGGLYKDVSEFIRHSVLRRLDGILGLPETRAGNVTEVEERVCRYLEGVPGPHDPVEVSITLGIDILATYGAIKTLFMSDQIEVVLYPQWIISRHETDEVF